MGERHTEEMRLLGLTIAFYRRARGLTQSELAEAVQISRTHMSNIEAPNSHTSVSYTHLRAHETGSGISDAVFCL